jgi:hypothetical protein
MKTAILISLTILIFLGLESCKKKAKPFVIAPIEYVKDIYITGTATENGTNQACYWKNGNKVILASSNEPCIATDIKVTANGDVYVCGRIGAKPQVFYWKNGIQYPVTNINDHCDASCIAINGDSVYIGGGVNNNVSQSYMPFIWSRKIGGSGNDIKMAPYSGFIYDIEFSKNNMYATGRIWNYDKEIYNAAYFTNGILSILSNQLSRAYDIHIDNGTVYICGNVTPQSQANAVYWKDGVQTNVTTGEYAEANCIDVYSNAVYIGGYTKNNNVYNAVYWNVKTKNVLNNSASYVGTIDIDVVSGDIYALTSTNVALYKNNAPILTLTNATPTSLFITKTLK